MCKTGQRFQPCFQQPVATIQNALARLWPGSLVVCCIESLQREKDGKDLTKKRPCHAELWHLLTVTVRCWQSSTRWTSGLSIGLCSCPKHCNVRARNCLYSSFLIPGSRKIRFFCCCAVKGVMTWGPSLPSHCPAATWAKSSSSGMPLPPSL